MPLVLQKGHKEREKASFGQPLNLTAISILQTSTPSLAHFRRHKADAKARIHKVKRNINRGVTFAEKE